MFDVGFWELAVIGVVALLVLGPERLPRAARTAGLWVSKARRTVTTMKAEIERELDMEEMKKVIDPNAVESLQEFSKDLKQEMKESLTIKKADLPDMEGINLSDQNGDQKENNAQRNNPEKNSQIESDQK